MGRIWAHISLLVACFCALLPSQAAPIVQVTTDITGNLNSIQVGQTATINVRAFIQSPASPNDGLFTFDLDLITANVIPAQPSVLSIQSITRPGVDDLTFGGSNGTIGPSGVSAIYGGYPIDTNGIGSPFLLFSVVVQGIAVGADSITPGPSVTPFGFDFTLYQSGAPVGVTYDNGVLLSVTSANGGGNGGGPNPIPLPPALCMGLLTALAALSAAHLIRSRHQKQI